MAIPASKIGKKSYSAMKSLLQNANKEEAKNEKIEVEEEEEERSPKSISFDPPSEINMPSTQLDFYCEHQPDDIAFMSTRNETSNDSSDNDSAEPDERDQTTEQDDSSDQPVEPDDGPLPKIKQPDTIEEEIEKIEKVKQKKKDENPEEEDSDDEQEMSEVEIYNFIKDNTKFFINEIKYNILEHYERTCQFGPNKYTYEDIDRKIKYIKTFHKKWYECAYESAIRDLALWKYNRPDFNFD